MGSWIGDFRRRFPSCVLSPVPTVGGEDIFVLCLNPSRVLQSIDHSTTVGVVIDEAIFDIIVKFGVLIFFFSW